MVEVRLLWEAAELVMISVFGPSVAQSEGQCLELGEAAQMAKRRVAERALGSLSLMMTASRSLQEYHSS